MSLKVVIDETKELSEADARLSSILEFVADDYERGVFYVFEEWTAYAYLSDSSAAYKPQRPRIVYLPKNGSESNETSEENSGQLPVIVPTNELVYSNSGIIQKGALEQQGLNATTALLVLAASGIEIALPNLSFNRSSQEEIALIRSKLQDERLQYLDAISKLADQSFDRIVSGEFKDLSVWARNEATLKILPQAKKLQAKLTKLDRPLLERAGVLFWKEGMPAIGKALYEQGGRAALKTLTEETIKALATTLSKSIEERRIPEATYILKLSKELL